MAMYHINQVIQPGHQTYYKAYKQGVERVSFTTEKACADWIRNDYNTSVPITEHTVGSFDIIEGQFSGYK